MPFNSLSFAIFFVVVFGLYVCLPHKWQNKLLLAASYFFYGCWDWRFLSLILLSTAVDYFCALKIYRSSRPKVPKRYLVASIAVNLSILGFFKYYGFFASSLQSLLQQFNISIQPHFINIILPVGISFYTFQAMSYTIDVYRREMVPTKHFLDFALFVSFFPQIVAGPIERARHLLPQILSPRKLSLDKFGEGCFLIFWGLFMKVFVADNLALVVDPIFASKATVSGAEVLIGLYAFAFQIFCDFAGYSNIARGLGMCMGFDIMVNFNLPYFAVNPQDFWQRWHISLSSWLRDYVYIPLGGNRRGTSATYRNLMITMLLGGLWHGAAWTFVLWGAYHGMLLIVHRALAPVFKKYSRPQGPFLPQAGFIIKVAVFFHLTCLGWLLFRARSIEQVFSMLKALLFDFSVNVPGDVNLLLGKLAFFTAFLLVIQIFQYRKNDLMVSFRCPVWLRVGVYLVIFYSIVIWGVNSAKYFIYFQF
ncbi:MAG: acyltransferase [Omnitrophica WOR_2 bacterium GWA2_47_8]|nr:MAG: acyltransferase [Omnitrophica WOR_2 bacterium GWA2_47_8]